MIVWGTDGRMLQDGEWSYDIKPGSDPKGNAAIGRTNPQKQMEYWFRDEMRGQETTLALDGTKTIESWFTSGVVAGKIRKIVQIKDNKEITINRSYYDERGNLIKKIMPNGSLNIFTYSQDGKSSKQNVIINGKNAYSIEYKNGKPVVENYADGKIEYTYDGKGRPEKLFFNGKLHSIKSYADDHSWMKEVVYNRDSQTAERVFYNEYDREGKHLLEKISELNGLHAEITRNYYYNEFGKLAKKVDSQQGITLYLVDAVKDQFQKPMRN
jgi:hypothetical protein